MQAQPSARPSPMATLPGSWWLRRGGYGANEPAVRARGDEESLDSPSAWSASNGGGGTPSSLRSLATLGFSFAAAKLPAFARLPVPVPVPPVAPPAAQRSLPAQRQSLTMQECSIPTERTDAIETTSSGYCCSPLTLPAESQVPVTRKGPKPDAPLPLPTFEPQTTPTLDSTQCFYTEPAGTAAAASPPPEDAVPAAPPAVSDALSPVAAAAAAVAAAAVTTLLPWRSPWQPVDQQQPQASPETPRESPRPTFAAVEPPPAAAPAPALSPANGREAAGGWRAGAQAQAQCLGPREPLESLADEFKFNESIVAKVAELQAHGYNAWRRVRGDGNCFYRAVGFALLEQLVMLAPRCGDWAVDLRERLQRVVLQDAGERAAHNDLLQHVTRLAEGGGWEALSECHAETTALGLLYRSVNDAHGTIDLALVRALRHLVAEYLLEHAHDASKGNGLPFEVLCSAEGYDGVAGFVETVVLPLGTEAEGLVMSVLPKALDLDLRIALLDRRASAALSFSDYPGENGEGEEEGAQSRTCRRKRPLIHVQLRPGHYDVLYCGDQHLAASKRADQPVSPVSPSPVAGRAPTFGADFGFFHWSVDESND
eukprot:TRINITY_DN9571_c0_g1_i2.p1 TRINITY_DN9571_c0_g1~~TRINITY_DN9571_c0_g1_i2.p1  ORF type:complete len:598 (+),score=129.31 TRINITY_DN9571_c0_g1_i2:116-1909(+)